ncbi:unnamed protein product [Candida verbasci]|uniref:Derlin n=1 Tax=Candida verbasci TaxID=1227364 RepID=A0A9W4TWQ0_9ASCO|nr:unnamed protein product [Candida verbasci]
MVQSTPIRGFANTPVTKSICIISTITPLLLSILSIKYLVQLIIDPFIIEYHQFWRVITYQFAVINESDYLLIILLWFQFKVLERFYGSRKYLSIVTLFAIYNSITSLIIMSVGQLLVYYLSFVIKVWLFKYDPTTVHYQTTILNEIIPGPIGILSSLYICFGQNIPISYYFQILLKKPTNDESSKVLNLTNRFPIHIMYTLLLLNNGFKSIIPSLIGLFIGKLYCYDLLPGVSWLLSSTIYHLFINPIKKFTNWYVFIRQKFSNQTLPESRASEEPEDDLDESRQEENRIRAETPVRPLGSQFLDTFRT